MLAAAVRDDASEARGRAFAEQVVDRFREAQGRSRALDSVERTGAAPSAVVPLPPPEPPVGAAEWPEPPPAELAPADAARVAAYEARLRARGSLAPQWATHPDGSVGILGQHQTLADVQLAGATGMLEPEAQVALLNGLSNALTVHGDAATRTNVATALLTELAPQTALEGLLVAQIAATHHVAMTMLKRATLPEQPPEIVDRCVTRAVRLQRVFLEQTAALGKLRGQGSQQTVTVVHEHRHVHVHQAAGAGPAPATTDGAPAPAIIPHLGPGVGVGSGAGADDSGA